MYALTSSMKGTASHRFANMVFKKADVKVCRYSSHALDIKLSNDFNKTRDRTPNLPFQASSIFSMDSRRNLNPRTRNLSTVAASFVGDNTSATTTEVLPVDDSGGARIGEGKKGRKIETNVSVKINLDGSGIADTSTGSPFLDHMLDQLASHGLLDIHVKANTTGDIQHVYPFRSRYYKEVAMAIGTALQDAVGDNKEYINRIGSFCTTHNDAVILAALNFSGHPHLGFCSYYIDTKKVVTDEYTSWEFSRRKKSDTTELVKHFFESLVNASDMTLHLKKLSGLDEDNIMEATFKAFAGALRQAIEYDPRRRPLLLDGTLPTAK